MLQLFLEMLSVAGVVRHYYGVRFQRARLLEHRLLVRGRHGIEYLAVRIVCDMACSRQQGQARNGTQHGFDVTGILLACRVLVVYVEDHPALHRPHNLAPAPEMRHEKLRHIRMMKRPLLRHMSPEFLVAIGAHRKHRFRLCPPETGDAYTRGLLRKVLIPEVLVQRAAAVLRPPDDRAFDTQLRQYLLRQEWHVRRVMGHARQMEHKG